MDSQTPIGIALYVQIISYIECFKFKKWLESLVHKTEKSHIYTVDYFDERTGTTKQEKLNYDRFVDHTMKKAKLLGILASRVSTAYMRLENSNEEKLFEFLNTSVEELNYILKTLPALDTFFKSEIPRNLRSRIKGIKLEITALKNSVIKANQKKHEFVSKQEEHEQMKKLGINMSST